MKNAPTLMTADAHISGINTLLSDIPAAFIASSSLFSPNVPNVIIEASSVASGSDSGIRVMLPQPRNSRMTFMLRPLPTSSSIYSHRNCIIRMKMTTSRIAMNGPMNDLSMNWSSFFISWSELMASASLSSSFKRGRPQRVLSSLRLLRKSSCTPVHCGFLIFASLEIPPFGSTSQMSFSERLTLYPAPFILECPLGILVKLFSTPIRGIS